MFFCNRRKGEVDIRFILGGRGKLIKEVWGWCVGGKGGCGGGGEGGGGGGGS